eukprot:1870002-Amphidinium_carterae.1
MSSTCWTSAVHTSIEICARGQTVKVKETLEKGFVLGSRPDELKTLRILNRTLRWVVAQNGQKERNIKSLSTPGTKSKFTPDMDLPIVPESCPTQRHWGMLKRAVAASEVAKVSHGRVRGGQ